MMKKKSNKLSSVFYVLKNTWKQDRVIFCDIVCIGIFGMLSSVASVYIPQYMLAGAEGTKNLYEALRGTGFLALVLAVSGFVSIYAENMLEARLINNRVYYLSLVQNKWMRTDYANVESISGQNGFGRAYHVIFNDDAGAYGMLKAGGQLLGSLLGISVYIKILASLNIWISLMILAAALIHYVVMRKDVAYEYKNRDQWEDLDRKIDYLYNRTTDKAYGKDIRLFGLRTGLNAVYAQLLADRNCWRVRIEKHHYLTAVSDALLLLIRNGAAYIYIIYAIIHGNISVSDFALYFGTITGLAVFMSSIMERISEVRKTIGDIEDVRNFLNMEDEPCGIEEFEENASIDLVFDKVSFRYPEADQDTLSDLSFHLKPGEKAALVGENGAGKTTLIKLLCGFYRPTSGEIRINGKSLEQYRPEALHRIIGVVFQEATVMPMSLGENVAMKGSEMIDRSKVMECLKEAGLSEYARSEKLDLPMTKVFSQEGLVFSGGMQQKLMLARALYRNAPLLLLDEPTAALDPLAELQMYKAYASMLKQRTGIFISHRLASTRFCDTILYLENGKITERGDHETLLKQNGAYAAMYQVQSKYYKEAVQ